MPIGGHVMRRSVEHEGSHAKYERECNATLNAAMAAAISAGKSPEDAVAIGKQAAFAAHGNYIADCDDPDQPIENPNT